MTKKLSALILLLCMALSFAVPVSAAVGIEEEFLSENRLRPMEDSLELIQNGGFEYTASATALTAWGLSAYTSDDESKIGGTVFNLNDKNNTSGEAKTQIVYSGNRALRVTNDAQLEAGASNNASQGFSLKRSSSMEEYRCELGASVYRLNDKGGAQIAAIFMRNGVSDRIELGFPLGEAPVGQWKRKIVAFTLPGDIESITLVLRCTSGSELIWDDISFLQECDATFIAEARPTEKKYPVAGTEANILDLPSDAKDGNCDFETVQTGSFAPWSFASSTPYAQSFTTAENHTTGGSRSALLTTSSSYTRATAYHKMPTSIVSGATYQLEAFIKVGSENAAGFGYEIDWYVYDPEKGEVHTQIPSGAGYTYQQKMEDGGWYQFLHDFVAPYPPEGYDSFSSARLRLRSSSPTKESVLYIDDVSLYMTKLPDVANVYSDEAIYYTEWKEGVVYATVDPYYEEAMTGGSMRCTIMDGEKVLQTPETISFAEVDGELVANWTFPTSLMIANKKGQTYSYRAEMLDSEGNVLQTMQDAIYRFDRPRYFGADGIFRKNGKEYNIGVANSCNMHWLDQGAADSGIQIVLMVGDGDHTLTERLDYAHEHGLLVLVNLGNSHACAGSPGSVLNTINIVNQVKNHPTLFGYKLQDEPIQKGTPLEHLINGYVTIRELDPNHVIYSDDGVYGAFWELARCTDYMDSDSYPGRNNSGQIISMTSELAEKASRGRKPFAILQKAYFNDTDSYLPTIDEFRHYAYQTLFAGAAGWGYHRFGKNDGGPPFMEQPVWNDVVAWEDSGEQDMMYDCFVNGKYPMLGAYEDDDMMWQLYAAEGKLYAFIVNRVGSVNNKSGSQTVNIPVRDASLSKNLGAFSATCKWGPAARRGQTASGTDNLSVTIENFTAEVWEITLANPVDFSDYNTVKYNDIADAPWAYQAVARLKAEDIINEETALRFAPYTNVTRGEYGMFLIRALELTAKTTSNFADVSKTDEYAKELAIGRYHKIFLKLDGNRFEPETPITRGEMLEMAARAMRVAGGLSDDAINAFGDAATLYDWALLDTASFMHSTFLAEKRDGLAEADGYATRAEAAVLIDHIRQWKTKGEEPKEGNFANGYANWSSAQEAETVWNAFLNETESNMTAGGIWDRTITANGNTYWLVANAGDTVQSTAARTHQFATRTAVLQSKGVSAYLDDEQQLRVTLPPGAVVVYRLASETNGYLEKDGVYLAAYEDGAAVSLPSGTYGAWYKHDGEITKLVNFLQDGDVITELGATDTLKFFSWNLSAIAPAGRAIEYGENEL